MFADRSLKVTQNYLDKNMEKLSSGLRINRAGDDASGLAVSEKLRSQIRGLNQSK
jgi:flagellin